MEEHPDERQNIRYLSLIRFFSQYVLHPSPISALVLSPILQGYYGERTSKCDSAPKAVGQRRACLTSQQAGDAAVCNE